MSAKSLKVLAVVAVAFGAISGFGAYAYLCKLDKELRGELVTTKQGLILPCELHIEGLDVFYATSSHCGGLRVENATSRAYEDGSIEWQPATSPQRAGLNRGW